MNRIATTLVAPQDTNPCVRNCCLDDGKVCMGCGRSLPEILEWHHADAIRQEQISIYAKRRLSDRKTAR